MNINTIINQPFISFIFGTIFGCIIQQISFIPFIVGLLLGIIAAQSYTLPNMKDFIIFTIMKLFNYLSSIYTKQKNRDTTSAENYDDSEELHKME